MPNIPFNRSLGRAVAFYDNVDNNTPANSALILIAINTTEADDTLGDLDTLAEVLANVNTAEVTNPNYTRKTLTDVDIVAWAPDDVNNHVLLDIPDQTYTAIGAGDAWTDWILGYDPDSTVGTDADIIPICLNDLIVTPDGNDINVQIPNGIYQSARG